MTTQVRIADDDIAAPVDLGPLPTPLELISSINGWQVAVRRPDGGTR